MREFRAAIEWEWSTYPQEKLAHLCEIFPILKGVAEAIGHCTWTQVKFTVTTAIYDLEMAASAKARLTFRFGLLP